MSHEKREGMREAARVLGVQPGASRAEVTAAHRALSRQWHPDKQQGLGADPLKATDMQTRLNRARETLLGSVVDEGSF